MNQVDEFERFIRQVNRNHSWKVLERAYSAYAANPEDIGKRFAALRALLMMCRLHDLDGNHAAILAELGRVDDEAVSGWQIVLQRRKLTRPHREKQKSDKDRRVKSLAQNRQWRRFMGVMNRIQVGDALPVACEVVASAEGKNVTAETVRQDYLAIAGQYRRAGRHTVALGNQDALRIIPLPRRGRRSKS